MKPISRKQLILLVLALANGRPLSRTRFQKAIFEIQEGLPEAYLSSRFDFQPRNFGAFSPAPYYVAAEYAEEKLAKLGPVREKDNFPSNYAASQRGIEVGRSYGFEFTEHWMNWMQFTVNRLLENPVSESLERLYDMRPEYAVNSKVKRDRRGKIIRYRPSERSESLYREDSGIPHTPPHNAIYMIKALTDLPQPSLAELLDVPVHVIASWQQGNAVPADAQSHVLAVADVLTRASRLYPKPHQLRSWLSSPVVPDGPTPEELLIAGEYDHARFYAASQPSLGLVAPSDWSRDPIPEAFLDNAENLRGASLDDAEDDLLSSRERHKSTW